MNAPYLASVAKEGPVWAWSVRRDGEIIAGGYRGTQREARRNARSYLAMLTHRLTNWRPAA